jgi:acyl carrier protein
VSAAPSDAELRKAVLAALRKVAPETDPAALDPSKSLRDQTDLDSMDFLNFLIGLHAALGVEIPESDYPRLSSVDAIVKYVRGRLPGGAESVR